MRALLSVYDKTGIVELAHGLLHLGYQLVSSGGTASALAEVGLPVTDTADITGYPAILDHRVVTLHPKVHGGILADPTDAYHRADLEKYEIELIDLVVVNLYPFDSSPSTELIDIGGPAMVRAAAKNCQRVGVVVDPADYGPILSELRERGDGTLASSTRHRLAAKAFATTAAYDTAVAHWLVTNPPPADTDDPRALDRPDATEDADATSLEALFPTTLDDGYDRYELALRYGENPHQKAALYRARGEKPWWSEMNKHSGVDLSYLNLYDADAAWLLVHDLAEMSGQPACVIIKHANPCGAAVADDLATAYQRAYECDTRSAFGGIVAFSQPVDQATADNMVAAAQADVVIAPAYAEGVVEQLAAKRKNTRIIEAPAPQPEQLHRRPITGGMLVQEPHRFVADRGSWRVVTEVAPTDEQWRDVELAWRVCGWVKSNSIVLVKDGQAVGIGAGQQNRVEAGQIAANKAAGRAAGGACASDAFYPFPDGVEAAADAGVAVVIQPGGSVKDDEVIAAANRLGLAMVFTGERHFLH